MAIKIDCPRCKKPLSVPSKKAGGYANCPECGGRFWVPKEAPAASPPRETVAKSPAATPAPSGGPPTAPGNPVSAPEVPSLAPPTTPPPVPPAGDSDSSGQSPPPVSSPRPIAVPRPPTPEKKVARFISAEAARSTLAVAEDGQLPDLHLQDSEKKEKTAQKSTTVNPLVMFALLSISVVASISLVLMDVGPESASQVRQQENARARIEDYFGEIGSPEPLEPYQLLLRESQRAHSSGHRKTERELYRQVLGLLRAERGRYAKPLTGRRFIDPTRPEKLSDEDLENQISILLR